MEARRSSAAANHGVAVFGLALSIATEVADEAQR
jgi:hypothetical protein